MDPAAQHQAPDRAAGPSALILARWLGPWADEGRSPEAHREELTLPGGPNGARSLRALAYSPKDGPCRGALLLLHGLHFSGPSDARIVRFCYILAAAGMRVYAPFLPDFQEMLVTEATIADAEHALAALLADRARPPSRAPAVMSISFGSLPALRLAAGPLGREVGSVITFGGYSDLATVLEFCVTGDAHGRRGVHDPLNLPVPLMNLWPYLPGPLPERAPLFAAWHRFVRATWGKPEMRVGERYLEVARQLAADVPEDGRALFLAACGQTKAHHGAGDGAPRPVDGTGDSVASASPWPDVAALCRAGLERSHEGLRFADPRPYLAGVTAAVLLIHGVSDDVIPHEESQVLAGELDGRAQLFLTGLYGHTSHAARLGSLAALGRELVTMVRVLSRLVRALGGRTP